MDRDRYSFIAHSGLDLCNPIASAKIDAALDVMNLAPHCRVLDIGAGQGEILFRIAQRHHALGVAVERSARCAATLRQRVDSLNLAHRVDVVEADAAEYALALLAAQDSSNDATRRDPSAARPTTQFDASLCVGSSHALGGFEAAISTLTRLTRPDGLILLGEGYWKRSPDPEYLVALGNASADESRPHHANIDLLVAHGLEPIWSTTASDDEWDQYEWSYFRNIDNFCRNNPSDPDAPAMLDRARAWRHTAQRWGRDTLGFALYLCRTPSGHRNLPAAP